MIEEITKWLEKQDYQQGIRLLEKYSPLKALARKLAKVETSANQKRLAHELQELIPAHHFIQIILPDQPNKVDIPKGNPSPPSTDPDAEALKLLGEVATLKSQLFHGRAKLSNTLINFPPSDNAGRKVVVDQINELSEQMNQIRKIQEGNSTPEKPQIEVPKDPTSLLKQRNNLRTRVSKQKKAVEAAGQEGNEAKFEKAQDKLKTLESELQKIEDLLNESTGKQ